jgi:hypothetical protein
MSNHKTLSELITELVQEKIALTGANVAMKENLRELRRRAALVFNY